MPIQLPLFLPENSWKPRESFLSFSHRSRIALDTETKDPNIKEKGPGWPTKDGHLLGASLAWRDGEDRYADYLPGWHPEDNVDPDKLVAYLKYELEKFEGELVLMNGMYDLGWLRTHGIRPTRCKFLDVMWRQALIDENRFSYSLNSIAKTANLVLKKEDELKVAAATYGIKFDEIKSNLWRLPARFVAEYAAYDADLTLAVADWQQPIIESQKLDKISELEHSLMIPLLDIRERGIRIDLSLAEQTKLRFQSLEREWRDEIRRLSGVEVDIDSAPSCAMAFDALGISYPRTLTGAPSFKAEWLEKLDHPIGKALRQARKFHKAWSTFIQSQILEKLSPNNRVHGEFHPLRSDEGGTVTGRFSSSNPNLQFIPARDPEVGPHIRGLYLPEEGELWAAVDYSGQEPRLTMHYAGKIDAPGAWDAIHKYREDPNTDYHTMAAEVTGLPRKDSKAINLGLPYGMGGGKLARSLGLPTEVWHTQDDNGEPMDVEVAGATAKEKIETYHSKFPFIKKIMERAEIDAQERGWIRTLGGRMCHFDLWQPKKRTKKYYPPLPYEDALSRYGLPLKRAFTHKALNKLIQGSAGDMIKMAIRELHREQFTILVSVHDENGLSVGSEAQARRAGKIMNECVELLVPLKVDIDIGKSWGEAKPMASEDTETVDG